MIEQLPADQKSYQKQLEKIDILKKSFQRYQKASKQTGFEGPSTQRNKMLIGMSLTSYVPVFPFEAFTKSLELGHKKQEAGQQKKQKLADEWSTQWFQIAGELTI